MNEVTLANFLAHKGKEVTPQTVGTYKATILKVWKICSEAVIASQSEVIKQLLNGLTLEHPIKAKYSETWDIQLLVNYADKLGASEEAIDIRDTLILLLRIFCLRRCGDCYNILWEKVDLEKNTFVQIRKKKDKGVTENESAPIPFDDYPEHPTLCLARAFKRYFEKFNSVREASSRRLFLALNGKEIKAATIRSRSQKHMISAGVPEKFKAHSIRMASASRMLDKGMRIEDVMKIGDWTSLHVFMVFYNRGRVQTKVPQKLVEVEETETRKVPESRKLPERRRGKSRTVAGGGF